MKRSVLLVFGLLLGLSSWAQSGAGRGSNCAILIQHRATAPSCLNGMDGALSIKVTGASAPVTIHWSDDASGTQRSGLAAGAYIVTVKDARGCVASMEMLVPQGNTLQGDLQISTQSGGGKLHRLKVSFADGSSPYALSIKALEGGPRTSWKTYQGEALAAGIYLVEAFTAAGCSQMGKIDLRNQQ